MKISLFSSHKDAHPLRVAYPHWEALQALLQQDGRTTKYGPAWSPASYPEGLTRAKANVEEVSCLVLDLDHLTRDQVVQVESDLARFSYLAHPSYSSKEEDYCLRFVIRLSRPVLAEEWLRFWPQAVRELCVPADPATSDASRLYFLPARPVGASFTLDVNEGEPLDVDGVLERAPLAAPQAQAIAGGQLHGPIPEGQREVTLHRLASSMRRTGWEADEILAAVALRNAKHCNPPLTDAEVVQTVASAQRYAVEDDQQGLSEFIALLDDRKKGPKRGGYVIDLIEFLEEFDADADDDDLWLIKGVLGRGVPQLMAGPPKAHKSWVMYSMALSLASGRPWLGEFETDRTRTMILSREDNAREAHRRTFRLARGQRLNPQDLRGWLSINARDPFRFSEQGYVDALKRDLDEWQPEVIFIDSLSRTHGGDENSSQDMAVVTGTWSELCKEYGVAILILHHFNKGDGGGLLSRMRGTSDLGAVVRNAIGVTKLEIDDPNFKGGISALEFEGNLPGMASAFSIGVRDGETDGHKAVFMEYRSAAKQEAYEQVKRDFVNFLTAAEPEPQTKNSIFQSTKAGSTVKTAVLTALVEAGVVVAHGKKYRVTDPA